MNDKIAAVITTEHRGVFFGYIPEETMQETTLAVTRCRMCIYWPSENHGVMGLASDGPKRGAKISPAVEEVILQDVTAVMRASPQAVDTWEAEPWS